MLPHVGKGENVERYTMQLESLDAQHPTVTSAAAMSAKFDAAAAGQAQRAGL